jgi:hypothetical protein
LRHLPKFLADNEWRRVRDVEELEKAIENASDGREKEKLQEHLNILYNQPLRISLFYKFALFRDFLLIFFKTRSLPT